MQLNEQIVEQIEEYITNQGLVIIELRLLRQSRRWVLRCVVDYPQGGVSLDDCAQLNRYLFKLIEEKQLLGDDFAVEVNSPGLDRPLKSAGDFSRVKGSSLMLWLKEPIEGKTYHEFLLERVDEREQIIEGRIKDKVIKIPLAAISTAKQKITIK